MKLLERPTRILRRAQSARIKRDSALGGAPHAKDEWSELESQFDRLSAALDRLVVEREWVATLAHELTTPLTALRVDIEALHDGIRPVTKTRLGVLLDQLARIAELVDDLRSFAPSPSGDFGYRMERIDAGQLARSEIERYRQSLVDAGIGIELEIRGSNFVIGDPLRLAQVVTNLVQNTERYTDAPGRLHVAVFDDGDGVVIDWMDSSPGVGDDELPLLTLRSYRGRDACARQDPCNHPAGLGLAIVETIVEAHGGSIEPRHSTLGGLWCRIRLPRSLAS